MKKILYIFLGLSVMLSLSLVSCETEELDTFQKPTISFEKDVVVVDLPVNQENDVESGVRIRLIGNSLATDVNVQITIDQANSSAVEGRDYSLETTNLVMNAGENFIDLPMTVKSKTVIPDSKQSLIMKISSVDSEVNLFESEVEVIIKKVIIDMADWTGVNGTYIFEGDGWSREGVTLSSGENKYDIVLYNFWGNGLDMEGHIDVTDPLDPKLVIPAGVKLDNGWDSMGAWYLDADLIGEFDKENKVINFTQFDYVTDDNTTGSFPWCEETCRIVQQ